jgi:N-acetylmuramoyl-L-alanine amidase
MRELERRGTSSNVLQEKKFEQHDDIKVLKNDVFIELADRAKVTNKADADLFCIHSL